jgi:hypothetical protein
MLSRLALLLASIPLLVLLLPVPAGAGEFDKLLPTDTVAVVSINLRQLVDSPLLRERSRVGKLLAQLRNNPQEIKKLLERKEVQDAYAALFQKELTRQLNNYGVDVKALGLEMLPDLERVSLGWRRDNDPLQGLVVLEGDFAHARLQAQARTVAGKNPQQFKISQRRSYEVWEVYATGTPAQPQLFAAFLNAKTFVLTSNRKSLEHALDQAADKKKSVLDSSLQQLLGKRPPTEAITYALRAEAASATGKALLERPEAKELLKKPGVPLLVDGLNLWLKNNGDQLTAAGAGLKFEKDFTYRISLTSKSPEDALKLRLRLDQAVALTMLAVLKIEDDKTQKYWLDVLYDISTRADGTVVSVEGRVEAARFGDFLKLLRL